ncbi:serine/threonine-protein kinase [Paraburkholderia sp. CNPSo 3274]|uniref:serine/threonine-protein kinase n=1 Tax=Paraburkholderia sp. CNPSo 3274 TaxID=2940932 RepID=UPI0020B72177|nr:serine/threonine-protein kinase [Paraburkholderia sp. CNPSo 3274]MCP3707691.1 serine/threonine-protein kinase [Paraburkholderia sp. CNPSo 3274]
MGRSEAESIYQAWNTSASKRAVTPVARVTGKFDEFRAHGFDIVTTRLLAYQRTHGSHKTAEQTWKLLEKFERRNGDIVARELMKVLQAGTVLKGMLAQFPAAMFPKLSDDAQEYATKLDPNNVVFPKTGKRIRIVRMLGKGGMGGAVFLGEEQNGQRYAVKHFVRDSYTVTGYGGPTPRNRLDKTSQYLMRYFEAALTTTCVDVLTLGRDEYVLLELGEGTVDYTTLNMSDIISVFEDLRKLYEFSRHYMTVDVTQDVSVLHLDIHGENLMRFGGKLRLIDFGQAIIFSPGQDDMVRSASPVAYVKTNPNLYFQNDSFLESKKAYYDQEQGSWKKYIDDWQQAYRVAPEVLLCESCNRQYPAGLDIKECLRCGSRKIVTAKLREVDINAIARLKGVSPGTIGDNPYAHGTVTSVDPQEYGCIVLTAVLIKEIWSATEHGRNLGMGGASARAIVNVNVYSQARRGMHLFKGEAQAGVVQILLMWFDEMMRRLFDGESFSARDAVTFFGGTRGSQASRLRRHSVAF